FPGWAALLPVAGTVALLAAGASEDGVGAGRLLTLQPLTWLGDRSYSLYLWHWPVLLLGAELLGHRASPWETTLLLLVALGLTEVGHRLVEEPFRRGRVRLSRGRSALWLWPIAVGAVVLSTVWVG